jgi:septal ring factor EnvC (AmiA/AmiB activator)
VRRLGLLLAGTWLALAPVAGAAPAEDLAAAGTGIVEAGAALAAARGAADRVTALAGAVADYEAAVRALRGAVEAAGADARARALALQVRRDELAHLLAAMQAAGQAPPARDLHPRGPVAAARAAAMAARVRPALAAEAERLRAQVAELAAAQALYDRGRAELSASLAALGAARGELGAALAAEPPAPVETSPTVTMMARDSETLTALAGALAAARDAPAAPEAAAALRWPVAGAVLRHFKEPDAAGVRRPGILMAAPALALVSAPADAAVRYAGPFLEYGYVLVLDPGGGTMVVLAGLAQLRVRTGTTVAAGELLGLLGGRAPDVDQHVMPGQDTGAGAGETLYIEVRDAKGPVDPEPLFAGNG